MSRPSVLACRQSGDHSENNLAKFGYILDMKVGKKKRERILLYSWLPTRTYHKNLATGGEKKSLKSGKFAFFSFQMKNPLYRSKIYFPGRNLV